MGELFSTNENLIRCEKRCEIALKRCEIADIEEFSLGNPCNQAIDFSNLWYVTSLIYYFKYCIGSFARKNYFRPKNCDKGLKNALLTDILLDKAYLATFEL